MNEKEIRALGFEPWYGGDEPSDYGGEVLFSGGARATDEHASVWCWSHYSHGYDVIGYKKKETPMEYPEWAMKRADDMLLNYHALCQHILDHEQPPVDPDLELARKVYLEWMDGCHSVEDAILAAIKEARNA